MSQEQNGLVRRDADASPDRERLDLIKRNYAPDADDNEFALYLDIADRLGLDPRAKQVYLISRYVKAEGRKIATIQIGIDGLRLMAERSGHYDGSDAPLWCGPDGIWQQIWLGPEPPTAAKVTVWRKGSERPVVGVALFRNFRQGSPVWAAMPEHMLAIAAERYALRKAFPADIAAWESTIERAVLTVDEVPDAEPLEAPRQLPAPRAEQPAPEPEPPGEPPPVNDDVPEGDAEPGAAERPVPLPEQPPEGEPQPVTDFYEYARERLALTRTETRARFPDNNPVDDDAEALRQALKAERLDNTRAGTAALLDVLARRITAAAAERAPILA